MTMSFPSLSVTITVLLKKPCGCGRRVDLEGIPVYCWASCLAFLFCFEGVFRGFGRSVSEVIVMVIMNSISDSNCAAETRLWVISYLKNTRSC